MTTSRSSTFCILGQDDVFGEDVCNEVTIGKSIADVYALTYSDLHCIDRNDLRDVLMMYPESGVEFSNKLKLTFNLRHQVCGFYTQMYITLVSF